MKFIACFAALLAIVAGCGGAHPVAIPTPRSSAARNLASSYAPRTTAATAASEQHTCTGSRPHTSVDALDIRQLRKPLKLSHGQLLLYPIRDHDRPTVDAAAALHPHDGAGNLYNPVYGGATAVLLLVRFTYVISIANPEPVVDRLAWVVLSNCVTLMSNGTLMSHGTSPPVTGYSVTVVDATTGLALMTVQTGPPLDVAQIGS
jgi:hypothetical protein